MNTITASGSPEARQSSKRPIAKLLIQVEKNSRKPKKPEHALAPPLPPSPEFPDVVITNILSFLPIISINKEFSKSLLKIYKETIVKRLHVKTEIVDALKNSDVVHIFQKLNELNPKLTATAIDMGFSLKQIATIPFDQLSEYITQYDDYVIPYDIQI
tara:strand:- start:432 stop:905 length:474 start_codon:yes stop_codon:yes gene_type:complete